jgi:hypothetical protein
MNRSAPGLRATLSCESSRYEQERIAIIVHLFIFGGENIPERGEHTPRVEPADPFQGGVLDSLKISPRPPLSNEFSLEGP